MRANFLKVDIILILWSFDAHFKALEINQINSISNLLCLGLSNKVSTFY